MRTLLIRQDWIGTGTLSVCPDVSSDEAKAARLTRYGSRCGGVQTQAPALQPGVIDLHEYASPGTLDGAALHGVEFDAGQVAVS